MFKSGSMTEETMIIRAPFSDEKGNTHDVAIFELAENDEFTGKYKCVIDSNEKIILERKDNLWFEGEKATDRAKAIGKLVEDYED